MCTPSRAKRNQPKSSHLPCLGMGAHRKEDNFRVGCVGCRGLCFSVSSEIRSSGPLSPQAPSQTPQRREPQLGASFLCPLRVGPPWTLLGPFGPSLGLPGPLWPLWALPWPLVPGPWGPGPWAQGPQKPMTAAKKTNDSSQKNQDSRDRKSVV